MIKWDIDGLRKIWKICVFNILVLILRPKIRDHFDLSPPLITLKRSFLDVSIAVWAFWRIKYWRWMTRRRKKLSVYHSTIEEDSHHWKLLVKTALHVKDLIEALEEGTVDRTTSKKALSIVFHALPDGPLRPIQEFNREKRPGTSCIIHLMERQWWICWENAITSWTRKLGTICMGGIMFLILVSNFPDWMQWDLHSRNHWRSPSCSLQ